MDNETTIIIDSAVTIYINHPTASYGIFCYNTKGDLFLNSDWGFYGYTWRSFGGSSFEKFLAQTNADYLCGKFATTHNNQMPSAKYWLKGRKEANVMLLLDQFIKTLNEKIISDAGNAAVSSKSDLNADIVKS
jgi:hypothetical protein